MADSISQQGQKLCPRRSSKSKNEAGRQSLESVRSSSRDTGSSKDAGGEFRQRVELKLK